MKVSKEQYEFFKSQYEEENERYSNLIKKSQIYLSLQTLLLSALFFKIKDLEDLISTSNCKTLMISLFGFTVFQILISIIFNVVSMKISKFEGVNRLRDVLGEYTSDSISNEEFYTSRIVDYTVATERNSIINNKSADYLKKSIYFLAIGLTLTIVFLILILIF